MSNHDDKSGADSDKYQRPADDADAGGDSIDESSSARSAAPADDLGQDSSEHADVPREDEPEEQSAANSEPVDSSEPEMATPEVAAVQKMPSRVPGYLGLLLGLCGLGLAGYLYYLTQLQDPLAPFEKRIDELATRAEANSGQVSTQSDALRKEIQSAMSTAMTTQTEQADALRAEIAEQQDNLEAAQAALAESLGETITAQPPTSRDWKLAEVEYLLRIANHRLIMERDPVTAGQLLTTADQILAGIGDFSLFDVRARLADEILSVKSMTGTDLQGLYLQVEAVKNTLKRCRYDRRNTWQHRLHQVMR